MEKTIDSPIKSAREMMASSPDYNFEKLFEISKHRDKYSESNDRGEKWNNLWDKFNELNFLLVGIFTK